MRQIHAVTKMAQEERLELWGKSPSFRMCLERAKVVSATDAAVLLLGETGVGKEVMANYVHRHSGCKGPFVAVHPASVSENLFENEFFGHEKGAFTGATGQKIGFFELADNGTLFLWQPTPLIGAGLSLCGLPIRIANLTALCKAAGLSVGTITMEGNAICLCARNASQH